MALENLPLQIPIWSDALVLPEVTVKEQHACFSWKFIRVGFLKPWLTKPGDLHCKQYNMDFCKQSMGFLKFTLHLKFETDCVNCILSVRELITKYRSSIEDLLKGDTRWNENHHSALIFGSYCHYSWNPFVFEFSGMGNWKMVRSRGLALWCGNWSAALRMSKCILEYLTGPDWVINYYGMSWWTTSSYTATLLFLHRGELLGRAPDFGLAWQGSSFGSLDAPAGVLPNALKVEQLYIVDCESCETDFACEQTEL